MNQFKEQTLLGNFSTQKIGIKCISLENLNIILHLQCFVRG